MSIIVKIFSAIKQKLYCKFNSFKQKFIKSDNQTEKPRRHFPVNWHRIGEVKTLLMYPLVSGNAETVISCYLHYNKAVGFENGFLIQNYMFVVYDEDSHIIQTAKEIFSLTEIIISSHDESTAILKGVDMEDMPLNLKINEYPHDYKICVASFYSELLIQISVLDCGQKVAEWIKRYTKKENLRLGYILCNLNPHSIFMQEYHKLVLEKGDYENIMVVLKCPELRDVYLLTVNNQVISDRPLQLYI